MLHKRLIILPFIFLYFSCFSIDFQILEKVEEELGIQIILDTTFQGSWPAVSYQKVADTGRVVSYLEILLNEYSKYPQGYLNQANVDKLIICDNLRYSGQKRAAIPDPYQKALYLEIDSTYSDNYLIHVMHHELHHSTEYALYQNMYFDWKKWNKKNEKEFAYGAGGAVTYEKEHAFIDYYSMTHPQKGFVNLYSTMGAEEDRCEIVALIMHDGERKFLQEFLKEDRILKKKTKLLIKELNSVKGMKFVTWKGVKK